MKYLNRRMVLKAPCSLFTVAPALAWLITPGVGHAQISGLPDAIEKAESLFMLTQRAAKAYFALGLGVRTQEAQKALDSSVQRFDRLLFELKAFASTPAIKKTYADVSAAWVDLKVELIGKAPSKASAAVIVALNKTVFELASTGTTQLQVLAKTPNSRLQDVAGNVRMLSQQLTKNYYLKNWGVQADAVTVEIQNASKSYLEGKAFLLAAPQTTPAIKTQIEMANNQWLFVASAIDTKKAPTPTHHSDVWGASENILSVMDGVCNAYFKLG